MMARYTTLKADLSVGKILRCRVTFRMTLFNDSMALVDIDRFTDRWWIAKEGIQIAPVA
jgi:hypothetical protein